MDYILYCLFFFICSNVHAEAIISSTSTVTINNSAASEGGGIYFDNYSLTNEGILTLTNNKSEITCPANTHWDGSSCVCNAGYVPNDSAEGCRIDCTGGQFWNGAQCVCASGQTWTGSNCVTCSGGTYWDAGWNSCVCPYGYGWVKTSVCISWINTSCDKYGSCSGYCAAYSTPNNCYSCSTLGMNTDATSCYSCYSYNDGKNYTCTSYYYRQPS